MTGHDGNLLFQFCQLWAVNWQSFILLFFSCFLQVNLTKSKSQEVYTDKHREKQQQEHQRGQLQIPGVSGSGPTTGFTAGDIYWAQSSTSRLDSISASQSLSALQIRSPQTSKRPLENVRNPMLLNLNIPVKRCRSISPSRSTEKDIPAPHQSQ